VQGNQFSADEVARLRRLLDEAAGRAAPTRPKPLRNIR
jgi:hypothetical protein